MLRDVPVRCDLERSAAPARLGEDAARPLPVETDADTSISAAVRSLNLDLADPSRDLPRFAKDEAATQAISDAAGKLRTEHRTSANAPKPSSLRRPSSGRQADQRCIQRHKK